ncbi:hypothetical protein Pcinc_008604 [Petrolisthes cinctipes]|uniref:Uncharacterized protein n=1 Tax=Petrolisthes cinctipes TaxID=88211 RepID=A0AAE1G753_PETCI|nr:hypothetical protein Pcinc_008604 [Petrolisthes cinctipes]
MVLMSPFARKEILKSVPKNTIMVDVWAHRRSTTYTEAEAMERMGLTLKEQQAVNIRNTKSDMDVIGSDVKWDALDSRMEDRCSNGSKKAHYMIPVGHRAHLMRHQLMYLLTNLMDEREALRCRQKEPLPPVLDAATTNLPLEELVTGLVYSDHTLERMVRFFKTHNYICRLIRYGKEGEKVLVCIKYIDKLNRIMSHRWAREARGMGFLVDTSLPRVIMIKRPLMRCVEVLTNDRTQVAIEESQDMKSKDDMTFLDEGQRSIVKAFNDNPPRTPFRGRNRGTSQKRWTDVYW